MNGDFDTLKFCGGDELVSTIIAGIITKIFGASKDKGLEHRLHDVWNTR